MEIEVEESQPKSKSMELKVEKSLSKSRSMEPEVEQINVGHSCSDLSLYVQ